MNNNFNKEQQKRYQGHLSLCEIDSGGQKAICAGKVLIVGAGGLGSPVALYLAAAGVGHIGIVDADNVSLSNLQRQIMHGTPDIGSPKVESAQREMNRINPEVTVTPYRLFLTEDNAGDIISGYDLVIDCTDNFETRLLLSNVSEKLGKGYIFGGVTRFQGQVFTQLPGTCNFRAIFGDEPPEYTEPCSVSGILNSVVGVVGALQATEAIKFLTKTGDLLTDRLLIFDAITMQFNIFNISK